jgi:hypothetical protein
MLWLFIIAAAGVAGVIEAAHHYSRYGDGR